MSFLAFCIVVYFLNSLFPYFLIPLFLDLFYVFDYHIHHGIAWTLFSNQPNNADTLTRQMMTVPAGGGNRFGKVKELFNLLLYNINDVLGNGRVGDFIKSIPYNPYSHCLFHD